MSGLLSQGCPTWQLLCLFLLGLVLLQRQVAFDSRSYPTTALQENGSAGVDTEMEVATVLRSLQELLQVRAEPNIAWQHVPLSSARKRMDDVRSVLAAVPPHLSVDGAAPVRGASPSLGGSQQTSRRVAARVATPGWQARGWNINETAYSVLPSRGCSDLHKERIHPGGFGASLMRLLWKYEEVWLNDTRPRDLVYDPTTWSYRCSKNATSWECFFRQMLPCTDPQYRKPEDLLPAAVGKDLTYQRIYAKKRRPFLSNWATMDNSGQIVRLPSPHPAAVERAYSTMFPLRVDRLAFMRKLAPMLLQPTAASMQHIQSQVQHAGIDLRSPFISLHFRRGDKARESTYSLPDAKTLVKNITHLGVDFDWVFVLTDDSQAIKELQAAAPDWKIKSFAEPESNGVYCVARATGCTKLCPPFCSPLSLSLSLSLALSPALNFSVRARVCMDVCVCVLLSHTSLDMRARVCGGGVCVCVCVCVGGGGGFL